MMKLAVISEKRVVYPTERHINITQKVDKNGGKSLTKSMASPKSLRYLSGRSLSLTSISVRSSS